MSRSKTGKFKPQSGNRRRFVVMIAAISLVAIAAVTVVSNQFIRTKTQPTAHTNSKGPAATAKLAEQDIHVDGQGGKVRPLTQEEAQRLGEELKSRLNRSTDGLVEQRHADGSVSLDLQDRFQSVVVARRNQDGTVAHSCVDNPRAAASFFGIDPKFVGVQSAPASAKTPVRNAPVKN